MDSRLTPELKLEIKQVLDSGVKVKHAASDGTIIIHDYNKTKTIFALRLDFTDGLKTNCGGTIKQISEWYKLESEVDNE